MIVLRAGGSTFSKGKKEKKKQQPAISCCGSVEKSLTRSQKAHLFVCLCKHMYSFIFMGVQFGRSSPEVACHLENLSWSSGCTFPRIHRAKDGSGVGVHHSPKTRPQSPARFSAGIHPSGDVGTFVAPCSSARVSEGRNCSVFFVILAAGAVL